jgi:small-conductance mechanosensitive channel
MMRSGSGFKSVAALMGVLLAWGAFEAQSQQPRRRPSRRATSPVRTTSVPAPQATPDYEPRVVSTAEEPAAQEGQTTNRTRRNRATPSPTPDETLKTMQTLLDEFGRLNKKVDDLEKERRVDLIQERLTRAEQRAEGLQTQLRDVLEKESNLQAQMDRVEEQSRPESIDRQAALTGTFRPDELRDTIRRQYDAEKRRIRAQLDVLQGSRTRLEGALNNADQLVGRLRTQLDDATQRELESDSSSSSSSTTGTLAAPRPTPTPSGTPPPQ